VKSLVRMSLFLLPILWCISLLSGGEVRGENPIRVAVFPFQFHAKENLDYLQEAIFVTISGRLIEGGDMEVVDFRTVRDALSGRDLSGVTDEAVREISSRLNADYAIVGNLTKVGEFVNLDARLISVERAGPPVGVASQYRGLDAAMEGLGEFADSIRRRIVVVSATPKKEEKPPEKSKIAAFYEKVVEGVKGEKPPPPQPTRGLETLQTLPTFIRGLGVGDLDGDGLNELVLMDSRTLFIYKQIGGKPQLFRKIRGRRNDNFLTLDVADVNRNGFSEIIVSNMRSGGLRSFILEFEQGRIKKISDRDRWFFRVTDIPGKGLTLVGQKMSSVKHPYGAIYRFKWKQKRFHPEKKPFIKKEIPVFSLAIADVEGRGEPSVIYVDYHDRLRVMNPQGAFRWESSAKYGASDIFYSIGSQGISDADKRLYIPGRVLTRDLDGDGISEVIVSQNTFKLNIVERLRSYRQARLVNLAWRGFGLAENWKIAEFSGYISDYQVEDIDNDGKDEIVMTGVSKGPLRSGASSSVLVYELF